MTHSSDPTTEAQPEGDAEIASLLEDVTDHAAVPEELGELVSAVVEQNRTLAEQNRQLRERVDELETDLERTHDVATAAVGTAQTNETRIDDLEETAEQTRDISKCAIAKAEQAGTTGHDDGSQADTDEPAPGGIKRSTSPLDFLANCRPENVREKYVVESNRDNTYRAVEVAKRWDEFATRRNDGSAIAWTRSDVKSALTAHLGESPHRQTVSRTYEKLAELGSDDVEERRHCVGRRQKPKRIIEMDIETARGLKEGRYQGLGLIEQADTITAGGVTPVVMEEPTPAL